MTRRRHTEYIDQHLERFHGTSWSLDWHDPTLDAAQYPHIIALTRLLTSPTWRALAIAETATARDHLAVSFFNPTGNHPSDPGATAFGNEIRRAIAPTYNWEQARWDHKDPLVNAFLHDREEELAQIRLRYNTPEPRTDTIESNELPHDQ